MYVEIHTMRAEVVNSHTWPLMESSSVHQRVKMTLCLSVCVCVCVSDSGA